MPANAICNNFCCNEVCCNEIDLVFSYTHYMLAWRGMYKDQTRPITRVMVVGQDDDGNDIFGAYEYTPDIDERILVRHHPEVNTAALCSNMAEELYLKSRFENIKGHIVVMPHLGIEIFDVIRVTDTVLAKTDVDYRVLGISTIYKANTNQFYQILVLGDV